MQNKGVSRADQDIVAAYFLCHRDRSDTDEFAKVGEKFIIDKLRPFRQSDFCKAVADLENIHCHREVLFRSLYRLHSATTNGPKFPDSESATSLANDFNRVAKELRTLNEVMESPIWQKSEREMTTFYAARAGDLNSDNNEAIQGSESPEFWSDRPPWSEMEPELLQDQRWLDSATTTVDLLARIDEDKILETEKVPRWLRVLFFSAGQNVKYREIIEVLRDPATTDHLQRCEKLLETFSWRPRKDIVGSYARARCYLYPTVATGGQPHFGLVADLLNSFENSTQDAELVRKNLQNFKDEHPFCYAQLQSSLREEHGSTRSQSGTM